MSGQDKFQRKLRCFKSGFLEYMDGLPSPEIYKKWAALTCVSGALERRVFTYMSRHTLYPNMYSVLIGPPGSGKSTAIRVVAKLWRSLGTLHVAPDSMTRAAAIDELKESLQTFIPTGGTQAASLIYHSMLIPANEMMELVSKHDTSLFSFYSLAWDCEDEYTERLRGRIGKDGEQKLTIEKPHVVMLTGAQPSILGKLLPEDSWKQGFASRLMLIYSDEESDVDLFGPVRALDEKQALALQHDLRIISMLSGEITWEVQAQEFMQQIAQDKDSWTLPNIEKIQGHRTRRMVHLAKISMCVSVCKSNSMRISRADVEEALSLLIEIEARFTDIFKELAQDSDKQIMEEVWELVWMEFMRNQRPVGKHYVLRKIADRVSTTRARYVYDMMKDTRMFKETEEEHTMIKTAGGNDVPTQFSTKAPKVVPVPRDEWNRY